MGNRAGALVFVALLMAGSARAEIFRQHEGFEFRHWNGRVGELHFPEMAGAGAALVDYDNDGDLDLFLVQGAELVAGKPPVTAYGGEGDPLDRLFRNDLEAPGKATFTDVTEASGLRSDGYGMGVAVGDYDGDGFADLYVTNLGANQLWRNRGDGTFEDTTARAGVGDPRWSSSATFADVDGDGWLDLYVVDYVDYRVAENVVCYATSSRRDYCGPDAFPPVSDTFYRNRGDGTFEDRTLPSGLSGHPGPGLGVVAGNFDGRPGIDLYVANDGEANPLWVLGEDGIWTDEALLAGLAVNRLGRPEAGMGVDAGDFDGDGDPDLVLAHLVGETHTLYLNAGDGLFEDRTLDAGLESTTLPFTSFGASWLDYDNDGWLDLAIASGGVKIDEALARAGDPHPLGQANQLYHNQARSGGGRQLVDVSAEAGAAFGRVEVSRGLAMGDVDNDGDSDLLLTNNDGPARLLINTVGQSNPWIGLLPVEGEPARVSFGARVEVDRAVGTLVRWVATDGSYASARDPRALFGLGTDPEIREVRVVWPDGEVERWDPPAPGRYHELRRGSGKPDAEEEAAEVKP